jgi:hypothetical protein
LEEELRLRYGVPIRNVLAAPKAINQAIAKHFAAGMRDEVVSAAVKKNGEKTTKGAGKTAQKSAEEKAAEKKEAIRKRLQPKTPEEIREQRMYGIIAINMSFFAAYLLDYFVFTPGAFFDAYTFLLFTIIPGVTALVCWQKFFKK